MAAKSRKPKIDSDSIKRLFEEFTIRNFAIPKDIDELIAESGISVSDFHKAYDSLAEVHRDIWKSFVERTITVLANDPQYATFSVREQLLSFYYTHLEILKQHRDFIKIVDDQIKRPVPLPAFLHGYKKEFIEYGKRLIKAGLQTGEVANRMFVNKSYTNGLWAQLVFVVKFWLKDHSEQFEKTDAAIEKAVTLSFELVRPGPVDSIVDFAKFVYQNRK